MINPKEWKSGRHQKMGRWPDPELYHSVEAIAKQNASCKFCIKHKRTCPMCAGVT
jgi:hypothetical protein